MKLFLTSRDGSVHALRGEHTCPTGQRADETVEVTPLQVRIFNLGPCSSCWPMRKSFEDLVEASAGRRQ